MKKAWMCVAIAWVTALSGTRAADVQVVKEGIARVPVRLVTAADGGGGADVFVRVLREDLARWGWFVLDDQAPMGVDAQARESGGRLSVAVRAVDRGGRVAFEAGELVKAAEARALAHRLADRLTRELCGAAGVASTSIVMIGAHGGRRDVYLCDADGANVRRITQDGTVCLSPAWSRDAAAVYYTSFHRGFPDIYRLDLAASRRAPVAGYPGINTGAAIAPDGVRMALTLSKDGNPDLYVKDLRSGRLDRVTRTPYAAEASPSWSPDGGRLVFVSDRSGRPHLYVKAGLGGDERRLTYTGRENVSPDWGPDGRIAYVSLRDRGYAVYIYDPQRGTHTELVNDGADWEDPSWAPDGRHLVCSRSAGHRSELYILDAEGGAPVRLTAMEGDWYAPAWSPR